MDNEKAEKPARFETITFGKRLSERRKEIGITQEQLAEILGISARTIIRYEKGELPPPFSVAVSLSYLLEFSLDGLWASSERKYMDKIKGKIAKACKQPDLLTNSPIPLSTEREKELLTTRQKKVMDDMRRLLRSQKTPMGLAAKNYFLALLLYCITKDISRTRKGDANYCGLRYVQPLSPRPIQEIEKQLAEVKNWEQEDLLPLMKILVDLYSHYCSSCEEVRWLREKVKNLQDKCGPIDNTDIHDIQNFINEHCLKREVELNKSSEHNTEAPEENTPPEDTDLPDDLWGFSIEDLYLSPLQNVRDELAKKSNWTDTEKLPLMLVLAELYSKALPLISDSSHDSVTK